MKIYLYYDNQIYIFNLPEARSGSYSFDANKDEISKLINIEARENEWVLFETEDCKIADADSYLREVVLKENHFYLISRNNIHYLIYVTVDDEKNMKAFQFKEQLNISVGTEFASMKYNCPYDKNLLFQISFNGKMVLLNYKQGNVYINKKRLQTAQYVIKSGDELELYGARILLVNDIFFFIADDNILSVDPVSAGLVPTHIQNSGKYENLEIKDKDLFSDDDYFSKAPRFRKTIETREIELSQPPQIETGGEMPFLLTAGPMFTMGLSSVMMLINPLSQLIAGTTDFKQSGPSIIMGVAMLLSSLLWPIITRIYNKHIKKKNIQITKEKYRQYIAEKEQELSEENASQKEIILENMFSLEKCIDNLKQRKLNFWDKRIDQSDFLLVRIGTGNEELKVKINYPEKGFTLEENELKNELENTIEKYKYIQNVPISYSFHENVITAIMGEDKKTYPFIDNVLLQLLTFYSYDDLKIVLFTNEKNKPYWDYIKYLNHNMMNDNSFRFFASTDESTARVCEVLRQEIENRISLTEKDNKERLFRPYYLVIVDDIDMVKQTNFIDDVIELKRNIGFSFIVLENKLSKLPSLCNNFISLGDNGSGVLKNSYEKQEQLLFQDEVNPNINMMDVAKILANIPIEMASSDEEEANLPDSITFLEMMKVGKVEQLNIMNRWNSNDSTSNLKAEVGVGADGKLMYLDLHEKAHGPHGLIAGMTGSGKSEFIITWILSLCMNFSPDDVAFILIDYKGGGLAFAFENKTMGIRLPHLTGTITNLDKAEINRTLVSIDSEVKRRQKIFNEARDVLGESTIDIYKYQSYYHEGKLKEPLPHLFIVCDEFAELKAQQPDFMDNLISVARIGRSLGVHLILATQKPSGVVNDQIWSNTKFRVCLKVQDTGDSNEMLKKPDAASLKQTGRFYLQVGYDEYFALGQSGWCGAKYYPSDILQKSVDKSVNILDETGLTIKSIQSGTSKAKQAEAEGEQLTAIMKEIIQVATTTKKEARRLWLDNIPEDITLEEISKKYQIQFQKGNYDILIGEVDAPEKQEQYPLIYNLLDHGNTYIVGIDSQESEELLHIVLYNVIFHFSPDEVSYYILDFGSQSFTKYKKSNHCGGVVSPGDTEEYNNLWKLIKEEQKSRKKILSEFGGSYSEYAKKNPGKMPIMLVMMNNFESIYESDNTLYEFFGEYIRDSERYGIVFMITCSAVNAIPDKFRQQLSYAIGLKLKDSNDYGYMFNSMRTKIEPRNLFGRGICKDDKLHEFQISFISKDLSEENTIIVNTIEKVNSNYNILAKKIPSLPEQVILSDVENKIKGLQKIPVGIEKGSLKVKAIDLTVDVGKIVLSSKLKYMKNFVQSLIDEILLLKKNLIVIDPNQILNDNHSKIVNYFTTDLDTKIEKIQAFIEKQKDKETIILIYSVGDTLKKIDNSNMIGDLFQTCTKNNAHVIVADEPKKLSNYTYEDWFKKIDTGEGVYIGTGASEQNILKISNYNRELSEKIPNNYGYYIAEGYYSPIKLIEFEKMEESEDDED